MRINTNVAAINAYSNLQRVQNDVSNSMAKLSSGLRINKAGDDAAGLAIANKFKSDIRATNQALKNAEQAKSVLTIAEGGVSQVQKILERMKELSVQAASATVDSNGQTRINTEFGELKAEITRITQTTKFQGQLLLGGGYGTSIDQDDSNSTALAAGTGIVDVVSTGAASGTWNVTSASTDANNTLTITHSVSGATQTVTGVADGKGEYAFEQLGLIVKTDANYTANVNGTSAGSADTSDIVVTGTTAKFLVGASVQSGVLDADQIGVASMDMRLSALSLTTTQVNNTANASSAVTAIEGAMSTVANTLATIGAKSNRIDTAIDALRTTVTNFTAAESVIRDVDMAQEMTAFSASQIKSQAGTAMLAQANQLGQGILQLLRG